LLESEKSEKCLKEQHLKDVMKYNIKVTFLEKEYARASDEIASIKDNLHKKTSEVLDIKEQVFLKDQEVDKNK